MICWRKNAPQHQQFCLGEVSVGSGYFVLWSKGCSYVGDIPACC